VCWPTKGCHRLERKVESGAQCDVADVPQTKITYRIIYILLNTTAECSLNQYFVTESK